MEALRQRTCCCSRRAAPSGSERPNYKLEKGLTLESYDTLARAQLATEHAVATIAREGPDDALATLSQAAALFAEAGDVRSRAVTMGKIADILGQRGETDEALRIRREERLPAAVSTQDVDSIAHIRFSCAMLRIGRGGLDPVLGTHNVGGWTVSSGQLARLIKGRGLRVDTDGANYGGGRQTASSIAASAPRGAPARSADSTGCSATSDNRAISPEAAARVPDD